MEVEIKDGSGSEGGTPLPGSPRSKSPAGGPKVANGNAATNGLADRK